MSTRVYVKLADVDVFLRVKQLEAELEQAQRIRESVALAALGRKHSGTVQAGDQTFSIKRVSSTKVRWADLCKAKLAQSTIKAALPFYTTKVNYLSIR